MEFAANPDKQVEIRVGARAFARHAIQTHFVQIGEDYIDLVERYVKPLYEDGDILSISEKIIALCQKRVVYKKDMKLSFMAKFLSRFAMHTDAGVGVDSPWKMQFAIDHCGIWKVLWAAICAGFGKLFGKHGIFYDIVGQEITGLDGFYDHVFSEYGNYGIRIPENSSGVCDEIYEKTGILAMIVDANDICRELLGKAGALNETTSDLMGMIDDNPAGQDTQCTPFVLIRETKAETQTAS
ncbi:MAG: F420-0--gamma-glutamyl ligase [Oscillospiraceae bacterium]|nr:F420-0--gamma-glutamyl ligase [Oscillospiraceae bacterium]